MRVHVIYITEMFERQYITELHDSTVDKDIRATYYQIKIVVLLHLEHHD